MTIIEFLKARIAEDEANAGSWYESWKDTMDSMEDRILAECAAKRQIIDFFAETLEDSSGRYTSGALLAERVLSAMAAVYANHPDYDPDREWRLQ